MTTRKYYFQKSNKMSVDIFHVFSSVSACMIQSVFMTGNSDHNLDYCSPPATSPLWEIRRSKKSFTTYFPAVFGRFLKFCLYGDESRTEIPWGENPIPNVFSSKSESWDSYSIWPADPRISSLCCPSFMVCLNIEFVWYDKTLYQARGPG